MHRKRLVILISVVAILLLAVITALSKERMPGTSGGLKEKEMDAPQVQLLEKTMDAEESSYRVGVTLPGTDFSVIGQILSEKIEQEWETFDSLTREQQLASSKLWGMVGVQTNTWQACEAAIGFAVYNPLESLDWLGKTGYFGMDSINPDMPARHILATAVTSTVDRTLREIHVTAGYNNGSVRITLAAMLASDTGTATTGSVSSGYADYTQYSTTTKTGIPVLVVVTNQSNNTGYYNGEFCDLTAYWVMENVFYSLRVFGEKTDQTEIQRTLDRILQ